MDSSLISIFKDSKMRLNETKTLDLMNEKMDGLNASINKSMTSHSSHVTITTPQIVNCVSFSPYEWSHYLLSFECNLRLSVIKLLLNDQRFETHFDYELIEDFVIGVKCCSIAFSPETNLEVLQKCLKLAIATFDNDIRIISSNLKPNQHNLDYLYLREHSDFINDIAFEPLNGLTLASVSDDCSCCLWTIDKSKVDLTAKLTLTSPGVSVKWHNSEPNKLFIAEKKGLIRFYNTETKRPVMSFDCNRYPLLSGDWSPNNSLFIGCVSGSDIFFWDTSLSSQPIEQRKGHIQGSQEFRFFDSNIIATRGRPNNTIRVENLKNNQVLLEENLKAGDGIAWNCKIPILAVGGTKAVHLFRFNSIL